LTLVAAFVQPDSAIAQNALQYLLKVGDQSVLQDIGPLLIGLIFERHPILLQDESQCVWQFFVVFLEECTFNVEDVPISLHHRLFVELHKQLALHPTGALCPFFRYARAVSMTNPNLWSMITRFDPSTTKESLRLLAPLLSTDNVRDVAMALGLIALLCRENKQWLTKLFTPANVNMLLEVTFHLSANLTDENTMDILTALWGQLLETTETAPMIHRSIESFPHLRSMMLSLLTLLTTGIPSFTVTIFQLTHHFCRLRLVCEVVCDILETQELWEMLLARITGGKGDSGGGGSSSHPRHPSTIIIQQIALPWLAQVLCGSPLVGATFADGPAAQPVAALLMDCFSNRRENSRIRALALLTLCKIWGRMPGQVWDWWQQVGSEAWSLWLEEAESQCRIVMADAPDTVREEHWQGVEWTAAILEGLLQIQSFHNVEEIAEIVHARDLHRALQRLVAVDREREEAMPLLVREAVLTLLAVLCLPGTGTPAGVQGQARLCQDIVPAWVAAFEECLPPTVGRRKDGGCVGKNERRATGVTIPLEAVLPLVDAYAEALRMAEGEKGDDPPPYHSQTEAEPTLEVKQRLSFLQLQLEEAQTMVETKSTMLMRADRIAQDARERRKEVEEALRGALAEVKGLTATCQRLEEDNSVLRESQKNWERDEQQWKSTLRQRQEQLQETKEALEIMLAESVPLQKSVEEKEKSLNQLRIEHDDLGLKYRQTTTTLEDLQHAYRHLQLNDEKSQRDTEILRAQIDGYLEECANLETTVSTLSAANGEMRAHIDECSMAIARLTEDNTQLREQLNTAQEQLAVATTEKQRQESTLAWNDSLVKMIHDLSSKMQVGPAGGSATATPASVAATPNPFGSSITAVSFTDTATAKSVNK
jgi:hypothetical protein